MPKEMGDTRTVISYLSVMIHERLTNMFTLSDRNSNSIGVLNMCTFDK